MLWLIGGIAVLLLAIVFAAIVCARSIKRTIDKWDEMEW